MKSKAIFRQAGFVALAGLLMGTAGCSTFSSEVRKADRVAVVDAQPGAANKGYAEFYTVATNYPVPVFILDNRGKAIQLASVGLPAGDLYDVARNGRVGASTLRVALPPGTNTFMIEYNGDIVQVPIEAGMVTPVEIDYTPLDNVTQNILYRENIRVFKPVPNR